MPDRRAFTASLLPSPMLAASAVLRMAYFDRYAPLSQRDAGGRVRGLLIDLVEAAGQAAGLRFSHHAYPWLRAQNMVRQAELDAVCTTRSPERLAYLRFCETPLLVLPFGFCHRRGDARFTGLRALEDLRGLRQGNYRGSGYARSHLESERIHLDGDPDSLLRRIAMGDLDVFIDAQLNAEHRIRALALEQQLMFSPAPFLPLAAYRFALRHSHPEAEEIVAKMEKATLGALAKGSLEAVIAGYR